MARRKQSLLQGTLEMLILGVLREGELHGYGVARRIESASGDGLAIEEGSLYPALHRMAKDGWIDATWGVSENNRRARYYRLNGKGHERLATEKKEWSRFATAVDRVLGNGESKERS